VVGGNGKELTLDRNQVELKSSSCSSFELMLMLEAAFELLLAMELACGVEIGLPLPPPSSLPPEVEASNRIKRLISDWLLVSIASVLLRLLLLLRFFNL